MSFFKLRLVLLTLLFVSSGVYSQNGMLDKLSRQDSTTTFNRKSWIDLSFGPSFTINPDGLDLFVFGPTIDLTFINHNYRIMKIKSSFHRGFAFFENFPQCSGELNFMTGKIKVTSNHTTEFYYGIGIIAGRKRVSIISDSKGEADGFSVSLPWTEYKKKDFIFVGVPFEYKLQWSVLGFGIDGNLNPYLPYLGAKCYLKIGNKYKK